MVRSQATRYTAIMAVPNVPDPMTCANCGVMSPVVMSMAKQGEQLVIARIDGKYYVTISCRNCGKVQQEIRDPAAG